MGTTMKELGIDRLSTEQQIALALEIWENLGERRPAGRLTDAQRAELKRRAAEMDSCAEDGMTWEQIRASIEGRK